jgi:uncharacterized protein YecE (DUF72 family)
VSDPPPRFVGSAMWNIPRPHRERFAPLGLQLEIRGRDRRPRRKLGPLLLQLPPSFAFEPRRVGRFLEVLSPPARPGGRLRAAPRVLDLACGSPHSSAKAQPSDRSMLG